MNNPGEAIIRQSAALRGDRKFHDAINLIQKNFELLGEDIKFNGWNECFLAAVELGDKEQAQRFAREIAKEHPDLPSIQRFL